MKQKLLAIVISLAVLAILPSPSFASVISTSPANGAVGVIVGTAVTTVFSEAVDPGSVDVGSFAVSSGGTVISGTFSTNGATVVFTPDRALNYGRVYDVRISTDVKGLTGAALTSVYAWSFTTMGSGAQGANFPTQTIISTDATTAFSVVAADMDDDGDLDVLSASDDDNTVEWFSNTDGEGTFAAPQNISNTAVGARSVFAADINQDGNADVLSASWGPTNGANSNMEFAWYENAYQASPPGVFGPQNVLGLHSSPISIIAADLDNDGDLDAVSASYGDGNIAWYENVDGTGGEWAEHTISTTDSDAWDVFAADLDNDGDLDVLSASNSSNYVTWYENRLNEASQNFGPEIIISNAASGARVVRAADLDQDGDLDVISASWFDGTIAWYENQEGTFGDPASNQRSIATAEVYTQAMNVADLDNDGDVDVMYGSWRNDTDGIGVHKVVWMENADGSGLTWVSHDISTQVIGCQSLYAADLDNDGDLDVLSASQDDNKIAWYENTNSMPVLNTIWDYEVQLDTGYNRLVLPDINADGYDELLLYEDFEQIRVISGADGATELWLYPLTANSIRYRRGLAVIDDLDDDGIKDIIVVAGTSGNDYNENNGDDDVYAISGAITPPGNRELWFEGTPLNLGYGASNPVVLSDVNNDTYPDLFVTTSTPELSPVLRGDYGYMISGRDGGILWNYTYAQSAPTFSQSSIWDVAGKTAAPDLDGDGKDDIVVSGAGGLGGVEAWKGGGVSAQNIWRSRQGEAIREPVVVGDLTDDGVPEIAAAKYNDNDLKLYVLNGATGVEEWNYPFGNTATTMQNIGDINGNGYPDIVMGSAYIGGFGGTDYNVYALEGNPGAATRVVWSYDVGENSYVKVVPDANNDGKKDVVITGQLDKIVILSGVDGTVLAQTSFPNGSGAAQVGEFDHMVGNDILTNVANTISALNLIAQDIPANRPPQRPILLSPANEAVFADSTSIALKSSAFSDPDGDVQFELTWKLERADSGEAMDPFPVTITQGPFPTERSLSISLGSGLKYIWQVGIKDTYGHEVWSKERAFKIGTSEGEVLPQIKAGQSLGDFGMISIVHWPNDPDPKAVFGIKYDPNNYRIGAWDPEEGHYIEFGKGLEMEPGRSVWILTREPLVVNFDGIPVSTEHDIDVKLDYNPGTQNGWNMIAPPNEARYYWEDVQVIVYDAGGQVIFGPQSILFMDIDNDYIDLRLWCWENGVYHDDANLMEPYQGYWAKAKAENVYLRFAHDYQVSGQGRGDSKWADLLKRTKRWIGIGILSAKEAIAGDNDSPPMPLGLFEDSLDPVFEGCFIETAIE